LVADVHYLHGAEMPLPQRVTIWELEVGAKFILCSTIDHEQSIALIFVKGYPADEDGKIPAMNLGGGTALISPQTLVIQIA